MLELPNPFAGEGGVIRLLEPAEARADELIRQIVADTYTKPYVIEADGARSMYFSRAHTQSDMRLGDPTALEFLYTQMMMSVLLFVHQPTHILMLGLGGGSLAKFCYRHLPTTHITAVEIDADVIAFRDQFMLPPDDSRLRVLHADGAHYLQQTKTKTDVVMIDAFDRDGFSKSVCTDVFYRDVRAALTPRGAMVANMVGPLKERAAHLDIIASVFDGNIIALPIAEEGNYLAFAFRDAHFEPRWRWITAQAAAMKARFGLDFPQFADALKACRREGYLQSSWLADAGA